MRIDKTPGYMGCIYEGIGGIMAMTMSLTGSIYVSGVRSFFHVIRDLLDDLRDSGLPMDEDVKEISLDHEYEEEGFIIIELKEPDKINKIKSAVITVVREQKSKEAIIQKVEIKHGSSEKRTLSIMLSISHPDFKEALRKEIEELTNNLTA